MPVFGTTNDIAKAIHDHARGLCAATKKAPPTKLPTVTKRTSLNAHGCNWDVAFPAEGDTKGETLAGIVKAQADGWQAQ